MVHLRANIRKHLLIIICLLVTLAGVFATPTMANAEQVSQIAIDSSNTTLRYELGSTISLSQIYVFINGSSTSSQCSTLAGATINQPENNAVGRKTITVSYGGQSTAYQVVVAPRTPGIYTFTKLDFDRVKVYSTTQKGVTGCNFAYKLSGAAAYTSMGTTTAKTDTYKYYDSKSLLKPGYTYYYKVRTYVDVNGERFYSNWSTAKAYTLPKLYGAERWRPEAKRQLTALGVYSKTRENIIINIIQHESGGSERAGIGRTCVGLLQFSTCWKHNYSQTYFKLHNIYNFQTDNRLSGSWSLHRVAMIIKAGGTNALKTYWPTTWNA